MPITVSLPSKHTRLVDEWNVVERVGYRCRGKIGFDQKFSFLDFEGKLRARQRPQFDRDFCSRCGPEGSTSPLKLVFGGRVRRTLAPKNPPFFRFFSNGAHLGLELKGGNLSFFFERVQKKAHKILHISMQSKYTLSGFVFTWCLIEICTFFQNFAKKSF